MDGTKLDFWKRFSIVIFLYGWFIVLVWIVPEYNVNGIAVEYDFIEKGGWTLFLIMLLHFTYATLDLVEKNEIWLESSREHIIKRSKVDLTVIYEVKKVVTIMGKRIKLELMKRLHRSVSNKKPGELKAAVFRAGQFANNSIKLREKVKDESHL